MRKNVTCFDDELWSSYTMYNVNMIVKLGEMFLFDYRHPGVLRDHPAGRHEEHPAEDRGDPPDCQQMGEQSAPRLAQPEQRKVPVQGGRRRGRKQRLQRHPRIGRLPQEYRREGRPGTIHLFVGHRVLALAAQKEIGIHRSNGTVSNRSFRKGSLMQPCTFEGPLIQKSRRKMS
ncbi:hypothetical protein NPIL_55741 [Nephila pilipes]|uniref:Uncharacterized protein n=1 Tax=Nephila pilipes TaxID=299642 RepID=A0A8X6UJK4_NEPPI|nr:hypothetical protein NPIL_55741 [Nephila pilipes]